jgi:hypothetical protein
MTGHRMERIDRSLTALTQAAFDPSPSSRLAAHQPEVALRFRLTIQRARSR